MVSVTLTCPICGNSFTLTSPYVLNNASINCPNCHEPLPETSRLVGNLTNMNSALQTLDAMSKNMDKDKWTIEINFSNLDA